MCCLQSDYAVADCNKIGSQPKEIGFVRQWRWWMPSPRGVPRLTSEEGSQGCGRALVGVLKIYWVCGKLFGIKWFSY